MKPFPEHREFSRRPIHARTEVRLLNGVILEGQAVDISYRGLMFLTERRLPIGKPVRVLLIPESDTPEQRINAGGYVARLHDEGVAVQFTEIDPDGLEYLRDRVLHDAALDRRPEKRPAQAVAAS